MTETWDDLLDELFSAPAPPAAPAGDEGDVLAQIVPLHPATTTAPAPPPPTPSRPRAAQQHERAIRPKPSLDPVDLLFAPPAQPELEVAPPLDGGEVAAGGGWLPEELSPAQRKQAARAAMRAKAAARKAEYERKKADFERARAEARATHWLPKGGDPGPKALRSYLPLKLSPSRATTDVLAGAYPFLAEAGLGNEGVLVGNDAWSGAAFCFDPWVLYQRGILTNPNILLAGIIGRGKSSLSKSLAIRSIAFGKRVYVPGDPKGEWTPVAAAVGGQTISLGQGLSTRINPLDAGQRPAVLPDARGELVPVTNDRWAAIVRERRTALLASLAEAALGRRLGAPEATALVAAVDAAAGRPPVPTLPDVVRALFDPPEPTSGSTIEELREDGREVGHALRRLVDGDLAGLFDGPSTARFNPALPMVTLDLSRISGSDLAIGLVMTCASSWMEAALTDPTAGQRWVIYDEAWRLIAQPALLARMQSQWKLSRALGIANLLVIHRLSDLDAVGDAGSAARNLALGLLADCSTRIVYAQERGEALRTASAIGLNQTEANVLPELRRGEGLWRVGERAFVVRHVLTPAELELFDTNARMVDRSPGSKEPGAVRVGAEAR